MMPTENKMGAGELLLVAAAVAWYFCATTHVSPGDRDMGLDPWQYLGNALAVARGEWGLFHPWRGVLHGWLVGKLMVPVGDLRRAAELLSVVSMCGTVLGTWFLGRLLLGRWVGVLAAWMFAIQPDLALFGMYHGVYGLLTGLVVLGLIGLVWTVRTMEAGRSFWVAAFVTGALFGLAWASDGRGLGIGIAGAVGLGVIGLIRADGDFEIGLRRPFLAAAVVMVAMVGVGRGVSSIQKIEPLPFAEQVEVQRLRSLPSTTRVDPSDARSATCRSQVSMQLSWRDFVGTCGRQVLAKNLSTLRASAPWSIWGAVGLMAFGLFSGPRRRERWMLLLPVATVVPAALLVSMKVRYLVPVMAPAFVCVAAGALAFGHWLKNKLNWPSPPVVAFGLIGVFCWSSHQNPHSKAAAHMAELTEDGALEPPTYSPLLWGDWGTPGREPWPTEPLVQFLRENVNKGEGVADCGDGTLRFALAPLPVAYGKIAPGLKLFNAAAKSIADRWQRQCDLLQRGGPTGVRSEQKETIRWLVLASGGGPQQWARGWRQVAQFESALEHQANVGNDQRAQTTKRQKWEHVLKWQESVDNGGQGGNPPPPTQNRR